MYEIIYGKTEHNLFEGPTPNTRTYQVTTTLPFVEGFDGWFTGVDTLDNDYACSDECRDALLADFPASGTVYDERSGTLDVHVRRDSDGGYSDATVYPDPDVAPEMLPISCAKCDKTIMGSTEDHDRFISTAFPQYVKTALWSSPAYASEDDDRTFEAHGKTIDDLTDGARDALMADLRGFIVSEWHLVSNMDPEQVAHDLWLTQNRHGAGFWDRGDGERGEALTKAAHVYGEVYLYLSDDGDVDV